MLTVVTSGWWDYGSFFLFVSFLSFLNINYKCLLIIYDVACIVLNNGLRAENKANSALTQIFQIGQFSYFS